MRKKSYGFLLAALFLCCFYNNLIAEETLAWKDCVSNAAKNHPDLISAQEAVKEKEASKRVTVSPVFPQIDSNAGASTSRTSTFSEGDKTKKTTASYTYGISGSQLIFDGLKTSDNIKVAGENILAAEYGYKFTSSEVRFRLRSAFVDLLKAQEGVTIAEQIFDIRRGNLELITLRYESGIEHRGALLNAQANLAEAEFDIAQAKRLLEVAQRALSKEMGSDKFSPMRVNGNFQVSALESERPDFEALAKANPSLGKLIAQKNSASYGIRSAQADFFPKLSAQAGANRSSADWPPRNKEWNAGLTVTMPVFEGGLRLAEVDQARALFNQAQANERSGKDNIVLTLEQAWVDLQDAIEMVAVQKKYLEAAEERAKISEAQYSLGLITFDNWTIIEDNLVSAKKTLLNVQANVLLAEANWIQAKGETLEYAQK